MDMYCNAKRRIKMGRKSRNCFACWHAARIEGSAAMCVCYATVSKSNPPDLIYSPYSGYCPSFVDKVEVEGGFDFDGGE